MAVDTSFQSFKFDICTILFSAFFHNFDAISGHSYSQSGHSYSKSGDSYDRESKKWELHKRKATNKNEREEDC